MDALKEKKIQKKMQLKCDKIETKKKQTENHQHGKKTKTKQKMNVLKI
jgi:hypothetical protein